MAELDDQLAGLVRDRGGALLRLAYQLTHDRSAAEDAVQEALFQVYRSMSRRGSAVDSLEAYVRRCVVNEFLKRQGRRSSSEVVTDQLGDTAVTAAGIETLPDQDETWRRLAELPERQRAVLVLRYYEDLPDSEIASLIDARPATVRSLAARGLAALRTASGVSPDAAPSSGGSR